MRDLPEFSHRTGAIVVFLVWILSTVGAGLLSALWQDRILFGYVLGSVISALVVRYIVISMVKHTLRQMTQDEQQNT